MSWSWTLLFIHFSYDYIEIIAIMTPWSCLTFICSKNWTAQFSFVKFYFWSFWRDDLKVLIKFDHKLSCSPVYHAINISFTVTYATREKKNSKIQDVQNWFSLSGNILCMFLKLNIFYLHIKRVLIYKKECITQFLWEYSRDWHDADWKKHCFHKKGDQTCK